MSWQDMRALLTARHECLSSTDRYVMLVLRVRVGDNGVCWPTQKTIARDTSLGERTVRASIAKLKSLGLVSVGTDGRHKIYKITGVEPRRAIQKRAIADVVIAANTGEPRQDTGSGRRRIPATAAARRNQWNDKEGAGLLSPPQNLSEEDRLRLAGEMGKLINRLSRKQG